jgi:hypothetical protein
MPPLFPRGIPLCRGCDLTPALGGTRWARQQTPRRVGCSPQRLRSLRTSVTPVSQANAAKKSRRHRVMHCGSTIDVVKHYPSAGAPLPGLHWAPLRARSRKMCANLVIACIPKTIHSSKYEQRKHSRETLVWSRTDSALPESCSLQRTACSPLWQRRARGDLRPGRLYQNLPPPFYERGVETLHGPGSLWMKTAMVFKSPDGRVNLRVEAAHPLGDVGMDAVP